MKPFYGENTKFQSWDYSSKASDYQDIQITGHQIREILLYTYFLACALW
jgi:hypothetical protein